MAIITMQKQLRRLGKIRMGEQKVSKGGKSYPAKLLTWRLTSPSEEYLDHAAALYGGTVRRWENAPGEGVQYEVTTDADSLDVLIPPGDGAFSQWYETWSAGGCQRRCDGVTETLSGEDCMCSPDPEQRECKTTTRLSVILPRLPDAGVWMLESHGYYAAAELGATIEIIRLAANSARPVPASIRIEPRTAKRGGETRNYIVPVIELAGLTIGALMTGEAPQQIASSTAAPALGPGGGAASRSVAGEQGGTQPAAKSELDAAPPPSRDLPPLPEDDEPTVPLATDEMRQEIGDWIDLMPAAAVDEANERWKAEVGMTIKQPERFTEDHYRKAVILLGDIGAKHASQASA